MAETKKKEKKPGFFSRIAKYFRDTKGEFKKIIWPTKKQVINNTLIVLAVVCIAGVFLFALDMGFGAVLKLVLKA